MTWAELVKERDEYKCVICGSTDRIQAHHIKPTFLYPEYKKDLDNGATLCYECHKKTHGTSFSGGGIKAVNGIDPDPENRIKEHNKQLLEESEERRLQTKGRHIVWSSTKENADIVIDAAIHAGQCPKRYIAEAISMRLTAEGFKHDKEIFLPAWSEWENDFWKDERII